MVRAPGGGRGREGERGRGPASGRGQLLVIQNIKMK